jgi:fumarylacetoacetase
VSTLATGSWVNVPEDSPFPVQNLPYGAYSPRSGDGRARTGVAIGSHVLDVAALALGDPECDPRVAEALDAPSLNRFMALGRARWRSTREWLTDRLTDERYRGLVEPHLLQLADVRLHLPFEPADYVDFYSSEHHASNVGRMFRPGGEPLTPNWKHLPIGYHGRTGTLVVSGTPVVRPSGQRRSADGPPAYGPSERLDVEAEVGFVVGVGSRLAEPVPVERFADHVFGVCLVNDWSSRDIQAWEYVPLGPFLGKSFATSVSPWLVTLDALEAARVAPPARDPEPLGYLRDAEPWALDLDLEIEWNGTLVSRPPFATMYWTAAQQLAHLTSNGATVRTGDLYASGTVSGPERGQRGSFLELSWNGQEPVRLDDGSERTFLADGDTVAIRASAPGLEGTRIGFGEVAGTILPARP